MATARKCEFEPTEEDVRHLREWLINTPHLIDDYEDHVLRTSLIACKGKLQKVKASYEKLNSLGFLYPHLFGHADPLDEITQYYLDNIYAFAMPEKTDDGCIVGVLASRPNKIDDYNKFTVHEFGRYALMSYVVLVWEKEIGASKFILVYDSQYTKLLAWKSITPTLIKDAIYLGLTFPLRIKSAHNLHPPYFLHPVLKIVKFFLPKKYYDRIHFHSSVEDLHKMIPKKFLPNEFGGEGGDLETLHNSWRMKVESYRDRMILEHNKMRRLDHLRPKPTGRTFLGISST